MNAGRHQAASTLTAMDRWQETIAQRAYELNAEPVPAADGLMQLSNNLRRP
jgi:hypothetical protein